MAFSFLNSKEDTMAANKTRVIVVGGGVTGVGIIRDLALRKIDAILIEQGDLGHGASSRFHGLLHSGARYALNDPAAAKECLEENLILKKIAASCIENTGGLYLQHELDDDSYLEDWQKGCLEAGILTKEISAKEVLKNEPFLSKKIKRAFLVPDATIDGSRLVWGNVDQAIKYGAKVFTYSKLDKIIIENNQVVGAEIVNTLTGERTYWECTIIINAAGSWADQVASLAGLELDLVKNKGTLLVFNQRFTSRVLNRLRRPSDGDIIVPHNTVTILGTTSVNIDNPDRAEPTSEEVDTLLSAGQELIPNIHSLRILRAYAGVRPLLFDMQHGEEQDGRNISRDFIMIDHGVRDSLAGLISLVGGKLTTYRLMAEKTVDYVANLLGERKPCLTKDVPLIEQEGAFHSGRKFSTYLEKYGEKGALLEQYLKDSPEKEAILCECENVSYAEVELVASWDSTNNLDDLRRKTRIGMGTCQGLYCSFRSLGTAWENLKKKKEKPLVQLITFLENRYKGQKSVLWESQLRENELTLGVYTANCNPARA